MTKQNWLFALLIGSSIGCFVGADRTPAQSVSGLKYRLQILPNTGPYAGGLSNPLSINNRDWATGAINPPNDLSEHPGLWRRNDDSQSGNQSWRLTDLGTLGGPSANVHSPIKNVMGWLAGASEIAVTDPNAENFCGLVCTTPTCPPTNHLCRGYLWRAETNKMIALPPLPGGRNSIANAANNNRQIAGIAENGVMEQGCAAPQVFLYEGVVWSLDASGAPFIQRRLPPVTGDAVSAAFGMNDAGIVVGASGGCAPPNIIPTSPPLRAVLWKDGGNPVDLGTLGGSQAIAFEINEQGQVVGQSLLPGDAVVHIFLWQQGVPTKDLGSLLSDDTSVGVQSINGRGEVVGWSCGPSEPLGCGPLYWRSGMKQPIDLNQVTQSPHLQICCASDINDSGEIVVAVFDPSYNGGDIRAAVLVPVQGEDEQGAWQNSQSESPAAAQPAVSSSDVLQRLRALSPRGFRLAR